MFFHLMFTQIEGPGAYPAYVEFWAVFYFCSDLPNFLACELEIILLIGKKILCIFFMIFSSFLRFNMCKKTLEKQIEGFFCFSLNKRTAKKAARKLNVFCVRYFSKMKRKPAKIQINVFLSICSSHAKN